MPRDLVGIRDVLKRLPVITGLMAEAATPLFNNFARSINPLIDLTKKLEGALEDFPPATLREGGIFKETHSQEISELRHLSRNAKGTIAAIETREKERTGISSLKIKYNKIFGFTIEITKTHLTKVPPEYIRKQTIHPASWYPLL